MMRVIISLFLVLSFYSPAQSEPVIEGKPNVWHAIRCIAHMNEAARNKEVPDFASPTGAASFKGKELSFWNGKARELTRDWDTGFDDEVGEEEFLIQNGESSELKSIIKGVKDVGKDKKGRQLYLIPGYFLMSTDPQNSAEHCLLEASEMMKLKAR